ncbi:MFS transporter [Paenibacillus sp. IITD108]|uniref:MFS transporter n=1 Tax=Paenibacillus sp. IITD108 TaxID=3116649 RepID=UPI002F3FEAE2
MAQSNVKINSKNVKYNIQDYIESVDKQNKLYRKTLIIIIISQIFGGAGLSAGVTVGALLAQDMIGSDSLAGLPTALFTLGSAAAAFIVGRLSQRLGRRVGLTAGFFAGGVGAIGVIIAAILDQLPLLFISLFIYGAGTATNLQARYAGTDLAGPTQRAKAISMAMVFTTFGAVAGPNLVDVMSKFAESIGVPPLAGPFMLASAAFLLAGTVLLIMLRPDPFIIAKGIAEAQQNRQGHAGRGQAAPQITAANKRGIVIGATVMVLTQIVMVAIMTMTPVHMKSHGHGLGEVGIVIGIHVAAMYLPSLITGVLVDKLGRTTMSYMAGLTLLAAGLLSALAPADSMLLLTLALALLGLGWNFGLISGTAQIVDATTPSTRAKTQGSVDVLIAIAGASGGAMSGAIVAHSSYTTLSLLGGILSLLLIPIIVWERSKRQPR